jgi:class 3 adenylate cyclase
VTATVLEKDGQPLAAVIHDAALLYDPALHSTVSRAVQLTLETVELRDELHARGGDTARLPVGDVTFLFGDVEGSTRLLEQLPTRYGDLLHEMRRLLLDALEAGNGRLVDARGDEVFAAFADPPSGVGAAIDFQRRLAAASWPEGVALRVRVGLHRGRPDRTRSGYIGMDVHLAARVMAAAHGGQILVSSSLFDAVDGVGATVRPLGQFALAGIPNPVALGQVQAAGLATEFPPPRARPSSPADTLEEPGRRAS